MPRAFLVGFSLALYAFIGFAILRWRPLARLGSWPPDPSWKRLWIVWLVFLFSLSPLTYQPHDMSVWLGAMDGLLRGGDCGPQYVYLPVYAEVLAALLLPFRELGIDTVWLALFVVHVPVFASYLACAQLMPAMLPSGKSLAPVAVVLAPVTVFYIFMGTNHIVMWALLLGAIVALRTRRFLWSGLLASLACYKFLLIPTVLLLGIIVAARFGRRPLTRFASGGALALVPSLIYYAYDPAFFARATGNLGAIGGHSQHLEEFHVLHAFRGIPGLETTYVQGRVWFYLAVLGVVLAAALYLRKRLNTFQALGLSCGVVALVSVEPFRMEPMVGLLWMDAVHRGDRRLQGAIAVLLFTHAAAWFPLASPRYLSFFPPAAGLWEAKGLYVGVALLSVLACVLLAGGGVDLLEEPVQGPLAESREPLA